MRQDPGSFSTTILLILTLLLGAAATTVAAATLPDTLVTPAWLAAHLDEPDLIILDCTVVVEQDERGGMRTVNGRPGFEAGHIPGAAFADLQGALSDDDGPFQYTLPSPEALAAAMEALGVGDGRRVVLYDRTYSVWAARVWWMLRWIGFDDAALLDGGLNGWKAGGHPVSTETTPPRPGELTVALRPDVFAVMDEVREAIGQDDTQLVDSLPPGHYRGEFAMYGRPGHIPGATNVSAFAVLDEAGRYRSRADLNALLTGERDERSITYCGGGIAASSVAFAMTRAGFEDVAVYAASLEEWAADPANPLVTGPEPTPGD